MAGPAWLAVMSLGLAAIGAGEASAQRPLPNFPRSDQSDVTGPAVTSGDQLAPLFAEPGTVRSMSCPVAWGVRTASDRVQAMLVSNALTSRTEAAAGPIPGPAQANVLALLSADRGESEAGAAVLAALTRRNQNADRQAKRLVAEARGLFGVMNQLDPLRPGREAPTQLARVTGAYNAFIDASADSFVTSPPAELIALRSALDELIEASIQNDGRPARLDQVDASGLACAGVAAAPPLVTAPAPPTPPADRPFEMCVLVNGDFRIVAGLLTPQGDSIALVDDQRVPLATLYPAAMNTETPPWVSLAEAVTIDGVQYQPFGVDRAVRPGEVFRLGYHQGFEYFGAAGETGTPVIYFVSGRDCVVQPYRSVETIRVRG